MSSPRARAIDWLRGIVMLLMTVDHAGNIFDRAHLHGDNGASWVPGSALPAGEFLTRWVTHLCAPTFVLLAGASLALSLEKRRGQLGQTRFIITRGLFIAALDPLWMSLGFAGYDRIICQVLYAIGLSMVCMAGLRHLSSRALFAGALAIQLFGELSSWVHPTSEPLHSLWAYLFVGGPTFGRGVSGYPLVPWLSIMMFGWVLGRWLLVPRTHVQRARTFALVGAGLLVAFALVRGVDGYGNWGLHRDSLDVLQWLHVAKYPPSLAFTALELGLAFLALAALTALDGRGPPPTGSIAAWRCGSIDDPAAARCALAPLAMFGSTAFFYYLLHVHLLALAQLVLQLDPTSDGLAKTWLAAALDVAILAGPCVLYRRYKTAHPDGWTRYV